MAIRVFRLDGDWMTTPSHVVAECAVLLRFGDVAILHHLPVDEESTTATDFTRLDFQESAAAVWDIMVRQSRHELKCVWFRSVAFADGHGHFDGCLDRLAWHFLFGCFVNECAGLRNLT